MRRSEEKEEVEVHRPWQESSESAEQDAEMIRQLEEDVRSICWSPPMVESSSESYHLSESDD